MQSRPTTTHHRFARLVAWLCALLAWIALGAPAHRNRTTPPLTMLRKMVACTIIVLAARYVRVVERPVPRRYGKPPRKLIPLRAVGGAWLRRRLRTRGSLFAQAGHLLSLLANRHALARALARRRGLPFTRFAPILVQESQATPLRSTAAMPAIANSS